MLYNIFPEHVFGKNHKNLHVIAAITHKLCINIKNRILDCKQNFINI